MKYRAIELGDGEFGVVSVGADGAEVTLPVRGESRGEALKAAADFIHPDLESTPSPVAWVAGAGSMTDRRTLADDIRRTQDEIANVESMLHESPSSLALKLNLKSLLKVQSQLEEEFAKEMNNPLADLESTPSPVAPGSSDLSGQDVSGAQALGKRKEGAMELIVPATLEAIRKGEVVAQFNEVLAEVIADVIDRPGVAGGRIASLRLTIKPKVDPNSGANFPTISAEVSSTLPGTKMDESGIVRDGQLMVSRAVQAELELDAPDNVESFESAKQGNGGE